MKRFLYSLASATLLLTTTVLIAGGTSAVQAQSPTPYSGGGSANLLEVHGDLSALGLDLADVVLSPVSTSVDSEGSPQSTADSANLDAALLGEIDLSGILVEANQTALPDNADPVENTLIPVPIDPLLNLGVSNALAHARFGANGQCLAEGASLSRAYNDTAQATVLDVPGTATVASLNTEGGVSYSESEVSMTGGGTVRGLESVSTAQVDTITLLAGTPLEINLGVASTPTLTATATGEPGGATVTYSEPLVTIDNPDLLAPLNDVGDALNDLLGGLLDDVLPGLLDPILNPSGGVLADVVSLEVLTGDEILAQPGNLVVSPDGTSAYGTTAVARVNLTVLGALGDPLLELSVDVGPMTAEVAVPEGGITCPPEGPTDNPLRDLHKDVSQLEVAPGGQFDYTLTIPNRGDCALTDVVVRDQIVAPDGTSVTADPAFDSQEGDTYVWNIGDVAPNETVTITVTVDVPADAPTGFVFSDILSAEGNCDGTPVEREVQLDEPEITNGFEGPCDLQQSNKASSHLEVMPGQTFQYFIHVFNQGAEPCSDIGVTDTLDDQVSFVACTDGCENDGADVSWSGLSLPAGSGMTLTITVQAADDATGALSNTAVIDSPDDPDGPVTVTNNGPEVTDQSVPAPPNPPGKSDPDDGSLPRTGGTVPAVAALVLAALAAYVWRLRRIVD